MDTKETVAAMLAQNEQMAILAEELGLEVQEKTLLECFNDVVECSKRDASHSRKYDYYYEVGERLVHQTKLQLMQIADAYGLTENQAILLAILVEACKGEDVDRKSLTEQMNINYVNFLSYDKALLELQKMKLVKRCRWGNLKVSQEMLDALSEGKPYHKPAITGLSSSNILARMNRIFIGLRDQEGDLKLSLEIDDMFLSNPNTSLAKTADKYGVIKTNDVYESDDEGENDNDFCQSMRRPERMLFYALIYKYSESDQDDCGWWDFKNFFEDCVFDNIQSLYKRGSLTLQRKNVIDYANIDGMVVKDRFHLTDEVKEQLFSDVGGIHERTPIAGMMLSDRIDEKKLYYNTATETQVATMEQLLSEERFNEIKTSLRSSGLRSGFTCLFYGGPGTGRTETVYQLARKTGRDIITADVTKIKSCWVGESEKNIKNLFSNYRRCVKESKVTPILFFNEADAIFGVRKEGADGAVDKMENSIQNIILQEMENLNGILIATTNLTQNLDKAFERRFLYKVKFDTPEVGIKAKIWTTMIPQLGEEYAGKLAEMFDFSGGQIENVSRKRMVQSLLSGKEPTFEEMVAFCSDEVIDNRRNGCNRIAPIQLNSATRV